MTVEERTIVKGKVADARAKHSNKKLGIQSERPILEPPGNPSEKGKPRPMNKPKKILQQRIN